jgi:hypothetical protein
MNITNYISSVSKSTLFNSALERPDVETYNERYISWIATKITDVVFEENRSRRASRVSVNHKEHKMWQNADSEFRFPHT